MNFKDRNNKRIGVLVGNIDDIPRLDELFPNKSSVDWYTFEYCIYQYIKDRNINYAPEPISGTSRAIDSLYHLVDNWYRDHDGNDLTLIEGMSHAQIISQSLRTSFSNIYKNYFSIKKLIDKIDILYVSDKEFTHTKKVLDALLSERVEYFNGIEKTHNPIFSFSPKATRLKNNKYPNIHRLSKIARLVQRPFLSYLRRKKKILVIQDWTYEKLMLKRNDTLSVNRLLPWKSYYFSIPKSIKKVFSPYFESELLDINRFALILERKGISFDNKLILLFIKEIKDTAYELCGNINRGLACFEDVLRYYDPEKVLIPVPSFYIQTMLAYLCKKKGILTYVSSDGYSTWVRPNHFLMRVCNNRILEDRRFCFSEKAKKMLNKYGISEDVLLNISPPCMNRLIKKSNNELEYDVIYILHFPDVHNPDTRQDFLFYFMCNMINMLKDLGFRRIGIKIKSNWSDEDLKLLEKCVPNILDNDVSIIMSAMTEAISKASTFIGSITSTSMMEVLYLEKIFYAFDPPEFGMSEELLQLCMISDRSLVAFTLGELRDNIKACNKIDTQPDFFNTGLSISNVSFT